MLEGNNFLEKLSEGGLLNNEQLCELDIDNVRRFVQIHLQKDIATLRRIEQLIIRTEAKVSRNELRLLFIFYLELLRQWAMQNDEMGNFCSEPTIRQFLLQFEHILTEEEANDGEDNKQHNWVSLLLEELVCEMFVEMSRTSATVTNASPFCYDIVKRLIPSLLANESTRIACRPAIESIALAVLELFDTKGIIFSALADDSLFSSLVHTLTSADFFIIVESVSRVLLKQSEIWRHARKTDSQRRVILQKAAKTQRIGPAFAELVAKICFAASLDPTIGGIAFKDRHGLSLILAQLAELLTEDTDGCCGLSRKRIFDLLASTSEWNLGLIGPLLPKYLTFCDNKNDLSDFLRLLFPSLVRRDHHPCSNQAICSFIEALLGTDSFLESIPQAFEQIIPHLLDTRLSAHNFFCNFCKMIQNSNPNSIILQQQFAEQSNLGMKLANLVSIALVGGTSADCSSVCDQFQWEHEHSALELINACPWIMQNISNRLALCDFLIRCALNESNSFLCGPALNILCKHFPCQTLKHCQRIYTQNFESAEVKSELLSFILQLVVGLSVRPSAEHSASDRIALIKDANDLLDTIEGMLEEEDSDQCLEKVFDLCNELSKCIPSTGDVERKREEQRKMAFQCRREELARQTQWRRNERQREELNVEALITTMINSCSVNILNREEKISKDCY